MSVGIQRFGASVFGFRVLKGLGHRAASRKGLGRFGMSRVHKGLS